MELYRWDPFTALARMDREFDELIRRTWGEGRPDRRAVTGYVPAVEMSVDGRDVVIRLELPGVDVDKDVAIEVDRGRLVISGERRDNRSDEGQGVLVRELRYGAFRREFALPEGVSPDSVEAKYDAGMLEVRVREVVQPEPEPRRVPINAGTSSDPKVIQAGSDQGDSKR